MNRGPHPGARAPVDFLAKAQGAWGAALPDWVRELAEEAMRNSATAVARRIGYSPAVISHVLAATYPGDLARVEAKVRGALMGATVVCPVLGEIGRDRCLDEQKMPFSAASSIRSKLYRACRSGCPHSRLGREASHAQ
jgi:hypothetical protein